MESSMDPSIGYIYLLRKASHYYINDNIYKIGCCEIFNKRIINYDNYSEIYSVYKVNNYRDVEKILLILFSKYFTQERLYGSECFRGSVFEMLDIIENFFVTYKIFLIEKVCLFTQYKNNVIFKQIIYTDSKINTKFNDYIDNLKKDNNIEVDKKDIQNYILFFDTYLVKKNMIINMIFL
jgi:hypothetical protein